MCMATLVKNRFRSSKKKAFIPSPRVLTPLGVKAIYQAIDEDAAPCDALKQAARRYMSNRAATK